MSSGYGWRDVAHTLNGYEVAGSFEACAERAHTVSRRLRAGEELAAIPTEDLRLALFFRARAERHGGNYAEKSPAEEAMVAELVRRHGADWLDAQLGRLRQRREG